MKKKKINAFFVLLFFYLGCSSATLDENDPRALLKDAEEEIKTNHYIIAIEKLKKIKNKFPYSQYSIEAQLRIADVYYIQESFTEAAIAYETFYELHPKHSKADYALFRAGKSYFNDTPKEVAKDLTTAKKSWELYSELSKNFKESPKISEAKKDTEAIRELLAEKDLYIADFYYKRNLFESSKSRYAKIELLYPETKSAKIAAEKIKDIERSNEKR